MPSLITISNLTITFLAMQAMAGPALPIHGNGNGNTHGHGHRRHHARRACRAKVHASASASASAAAAASTSDVAGLGNGTVPIYVSAGGVSLMDNSTVGGQEQEQATGSSSIASATESSTSSQFEAGAGVASEINGSSSLIGNGYAATGSASTDSAVSAVPTSQSMNANEVDPVSGFIASSTSAEADKGLIDISISLGLPGIPGYTSTAAPSVSATSLSLSSAASVTDSSVTDSSISSAIASPSASSPALPPVTGTNDKRVFAHYMVGIVSQFEQADWEKDMKIAKDHGIDGFALNIGTDDYTQKQLDLAFSAAEVIDFDLFISFDFNWYSTSDVDGVATMFKRYMDKPKQYKVDGKPFVSTFIGDGFDWGAVEKQVGKPIHSVPFYEPSASNADLPSLSGLFSWAAWPGQLGNVPVKEEMSDARDLLYMSFTDPVQKDYMAPVSPWFFTHFGKEVSYSKNWLFYSETLWYDRWEQILKLQDNLKFLEIVTWNDYGESHYIGPYDTPHTDDGSSRYTKGLDHSAHLEFAVPYIKAFKTGSRTPIIEQDMLVYWYRPHLKAATCDSTDNCGSKPDGWDMVADEVFVATMTKNGGSFTATSGGNGAVTHEAGAGVQIFRIPMGVGEQSFTFTAAGQSGADTSTIPISAECWNGVYNFNYHSGSIKL